MYEYEVYLLAFAGFMLLLALGAIVMRHRHKPENDTQDKSADEGLSVATQRKLFAVYFNDTQIQRRLK
jgi:hypothetical protein